MIYKKVFSIFFAVLLSAAAFAQGETDDFSGKWKTEEGDVIVISKSAAGFVGEAEKKKIVILKDINFQNVSINLYHEYLCC